MVFRMTSTPGIRHVPERGRILEQDLVLHRDPLELRRDLSFAAFWLIGTPWLPPHRSEEELTLEPLDANEQVLGRKTLHLRSRTSPLFVVSGGAGVSFEGEGYSRVSVGVPLFWEIIVPTGGYSFPFSSPSSTPKGWEVGSDLGVGCLPSQSSPTSPFWNGICHVLVPRIRGRYTFDSKRFGLGASIDYEALGLGPVDTTVGALFDAYFPSKRTHDGDQVLELRLGVVY